MCAGKSTIAKMLAERLGIRRYELDELRQDYYDEIGYDKELASKIANGKEGMMGLIKYWKPFEAHAVERALSEYKNCVLDFGAGHSVYEDENLFTRVQNAFTPFDYVILILPSADSDESVDVLNARFSRLLQREVGKVDPKLLDLNEHFVKHPSNQRLAKMTIYTQGKSPEETCNEILEKINDG
jgi:shikimate kinase